MKGKLYLVRVTDSVFDMVHGFFQEVNEIYIPDLKMAFNVRFDDSGSMKGEVKDWHCFSVTDLDRYKSCNARFIKEVDVPEEVCQAMGRYWLAQVGMGGPVTWFRFLVHEQPVPQATKDVDESKGRRSKTKKSQ